MTISGSVDWVDIIIGFFLGLSPLLTQWVVRLARVYGGPSRKKFIGSFWKYYRSSRGDGEVIESSMRVSRSTLGRLVVREETEPGTPDGGGLHYKGELSNRDGMIRYIDLRNVQGYERTRAVVIDPFYASIVTTIGVEVGLDFRGLPVAVPILLSRERLDRAEVHSRLQDAVITTDALLLR